MPKRSPLAPESFPIMPAIEGVALASIPCGITYKNRCDVMVAQLAEGTAVAGTLTQSKTASANIQWARTCLPYGKARVLIVNAGNANAFNGKCGEESVARIVAHCADIWQCQQQEVYPCATGVIGQPLPDQIITDKLATLKDSLTPQGWEEAAKAMMTTDTFPKGATQTAMIGDTKVTLNGIAKGSGMIAPDMATMLAYIFTDAALDADVLQTLLSQAVDTTFNAITVDSDTSTSDTLLLFATAKADHAPIIDTADPQLADFKEKLALLCLDLAHQIVKDGEGASKFVTITVAGAQNNKAAKTIAMAIANSPLVKTAIAGEDANWGRIVMAVGKAGEDAHRDAMTVSIGGTLIVEHGQLNPAYDEAPVTQHMQGQNVVIEVDVGTQSNGTFTAWTCDFTHDYITINADYRS